MPNSQDRQHWFLVGQTMQQQGRLTEAAAIYQNVLRQDPRHADALHLLGLVALQTGQAQQGVDLIRKAVAVRPAYPEALANLGLGYSALRRHAEALGCFDKALKLRPKMAEVHDNRGTTLRDLGRLTDAVAAHDRAIALRPNDAGAHSNRGNALRDLHRYDEALASYERALAQQPGFLEASCNRAIVLKELHRYSDALAAFDHALGLSPAMPEAHYGRGNALRDLHRPDDALAAFDRAITLKPDYPEAHNGRGNALHDLHRAEEALASFQRAVALVPTYAAAHFNIGRTLSAQQREIAALESFDRALAIKPDDAETWRCKGLALNALKRYAEAIASYERALALKPDTPWLLGDLLSAKRQICNWNDTLADEIPRLVERGQRVITPFTLMALPGSPALHHQAADIFAGTLYPAINPKLPAYPDHPKIRIGYFSADFRDHAMMHVMIGLFAEHDRSRFEVIAFSLGADTNDPWRDKAAAAFDKFIDVRTLSDQDIAGLARREQIDIAIDLMGYTMGCRPLMFAHRAAPVQATWLGHPGTMAADYIDYIIADRTLIPDGEENFYREKIVFLPDTYQVNDRNRPLPRGTTSRADHHLPDAAFVFCCFNNTYKISPETFAGWLRILDQVPDSVLWLYEENPEAAANLKQHDRIVFAGRLPMVDHLDRQRCADLFLDTQPYTGHATTSLALWAGLPVLTILGNTLPGRVSASLLRAIEMPELIAPTQDAYEEMAVDLATNPDKLRAIKAKLDANRLTTSLFDTARFARHLEAAFTKMHARAGQPPVAIHVPALRDPATAHR